MKVLDAFIADPFNIGTHPFALDYIRQTLVRDHIRQFPSSVDLVNNGLAIDYITVDPEDPSYTGTRKLFVQGHVTDNCSTDLKLNDYAKIEDMWIKFLLSLKSLQLEPDEDPIPVTDVQYLLPEIKCDEVLDPNCEYGAIDIEINGLRDGNQLLMMVMMVVMIAISITNF